MTPLTSSASTSLGSATSSTWALAPCASEVQQRVRSFVRQVPYGDTVTYRELARRLGDDVTAQQVGAAVSQNPLCIFVP